MMVERILNLGCGRDIMTDAMNVDAIGFEGAMRFDLNLKRWPFSDDQFDMVYAKDILEHLDSVVDAMREIWRVSRHGAIVHVHVPYAGTVSHHTDITHKRGFTYLSFDYFDKGTSHGQRYGYLDKEDFIILKTCRKRDNLTVLLRVQKYSRSERDVGMQESEWQRILFAHLRRFF